MIWATVLAMVGDPTSPPPAATPRAVVAALFEAFNRHDADAIAALYADAATLTSPDRCGVGGKGDVASSYRALFAAYPDVHDRVERVVADGAWVTVRFTAVSRQRSLAMPVIAMLEVRDGRIVRDETLFDAGGAPCEPWSTPSGTVPPPPPGS